MCCSLSNKDSAQARMIVVLKFLLISPVIFPRMPSEQSKPCARLKLAVRDSAKNLDQLVEVWGDIAIRSSNKAASLQAA